MNNEKMGKFICDMRKSQKLTQKDLAEKLKITDKAVSKWERGISCPDISLLVPLVQALGVTTSELLNGERGVQPEKTKDAIVEETLLYSSKSTTQKLERVKNIVFSLLSSAIILTAVICMICDFCIAGRLNWSLIVLASLLFSWLLLLPLLKARGRIIVKFLALLSVAVFPYLFILSRLVEAPMLFRMGAVISLISLIGIWCIYASFVKISSRKIRAAGIVLLIIIPMMWGINSSVAYFLRQPLDSSTKFVDSLMTVLLIISAGICFWKGFSVQDGE